MGLPGRIYSHLRDPVGNCPVYAIEKEKNYPKIPFPKYNQMTEDHHIHKERQQNNKIIRKYKRKHKILQAKTKRFNRTLTGVKKLRTETTEERI